MDLLGMSVPILFSPEAAQESNQSVQANHAALSPIAYNSLVAELAILMDAIADPLRSAQAEHSGQELAVETYHGPQAAYNGHEVPVMGAMARPTDVERAMWWDALADIAERLQDGVSWVSGGTTTTRSDARLILLVGPAAAAACSIDASYADPAGYLYNVPAEISNVWAPLVAGASSYAQRIQAMANGSNDASVTTQTAIEVTVRPQVVALAGELAAERKKKRWWSGGGFVAGVAGMFGLGTLAGGMRKGTRRRKRR